MKKAGIVCMAVLGILMAGNVSAALLTINDPNAGLLGTGLPGPYATVQITRTSATEANIVFTGLPVGATSNHYLMGGEGVADLNVNAQSFTASNFSWTGGSGSTSIPTNIGSGTVSDFGFFNLTLKAFDGFGAAVGTLSFKLTNNSGTWALDTDVLTPNTSGFSAASHIFPPSGFATGYAGDGGGTPVPEPASMVLLGSGLVGLAGWGRKKFRK